ncbi:MAG: nucleotidyltransferase domain-containing protein [Planctomycetota bacterium]
MNEPASVLQDLGAPPEIVEALTRLREQLVAAGGANLRGLIVYGSVARGCHRHDGDINVVVLLNDAACAALSAIAPAMREARRAVSVDPFVLTIAEVPRVADVFPVKILDIQAHHVVLYGENPFPGVTVDREHVRLHLEQQLRNLGMRMRRRFLAVADDPAALATTLDTVARSLSVNLATLMRLQRRELPPGNDEAEVLTAAARAFDLDHEAMKRIATLRDEGEPSGDLTALYDRAQAVIERVTHIVDTTDTQEESGTGS